MLDKKKLKEFVKERDKVVKTYDVEKFKEFYAKWENKGYYYLPLPKDNIIEISLRKMVYNMKSATEQEKTEAKAWLEERGCTTKL